VEGVVGGASWIARAAGNYFRQSTEYVVNAGVERTI
jgi:hypothetical protein